MFDEIRRDLPNIPEEAVQLWIEPLAQKNGWPVSDGWDMRITGEPFSFWNDAIWEKTRLDLTQIEFSRGHKNMMRGLHDAYISGVQNDYWRLLGNDGKTRFQRAFHFVVRNQVFPQPPILLLNEMGQYEALDGNHRFLAYVLAFRTHEQFLTSSEVEQAAFLFTLNRQSFEPPHNTQEVWVCTPNWVNSERSRTRTYLRGFGMDI